jgi:alkylation response protein AidB-like acyl-CoA dehydrogenase
VDIREFEQDVTAWFEANSPLRWKELAVQQSEDEYLEFQRSWLTALNSKGFGTPGVPRAWGGGGFGRQSYSPPRRE